MTGSSKINSNDINSSGNSSTGNMTNKPPRNPNKAPLGKLIAPIDHEKQRQKLQEIMDHLLQNQDDENQNLAKLYESLNPSKKSLNPLLNGGKIRN